MSNVEIRSAIHNLTQVLATQVARDARVQVNPNASTTASRIRSAMLIPSMDISRLMVHAEQIEEQKLKKVGRELKRSRADDGNSSNVRFEIQNKPMFKQRFSNQGPPNTPRVNKGKVSTPKPQETKCGGPYVEKPICTKCGRKHEGKCLVGTGNCYGCGKSGNMRRENAQAQASGPNPDAPKKNRFYALQSRGDQDSSLDVVTAIIVDCWLL
ncbi:uncharacterized protein LOC125819236 [Solanum verrucosum]|uniref:uncharacterized protein LOC125819236 n=1 Tax=Solanum verrucosum TaxID=315347 RepID=UPI0020D110A9|nr:uncharacterized protein LOC125819236 [Solanum verrucosum]